MKIYDEIPAPPPPLFSAGYKAGLADGKAEIAALESSGLRAMAEEVDRQKAEIERLRAALKELEPYLDLPGLLIVSKALAGAQK